MNLNYALIFAVIIQAVGLIWYVSKLDSKVETMYASFEEENRKDVIENQVKMKLDLENLMEQVSSLTKDMKKMRNKDKEIMEQHDQIFNLLQGDNNTNAGSYSYD